MSFASRLLYIAKELVSSLRSAPTLGARAVVVQDSQILLVRQTYYKGWFLPGGAVDQGETFEEAMRRELEEECGIQVKHSQLLGVYLNRKRKRDDHIAIYVVSQFEGQARIVDPKEVAAIKFFSPNALPDDLWAGHRKRIEEFLERRTIESHW
jgi:ADP-ribose pyrophosphatase YjhB (NUDIX family)